MESASEQMCLMCVPCCSVYCIDPDILMCCRFRRIVSEPIALHRGRKYVILCFAKYPCTEKNSHCSYTFNYVYILCCVRIRCMTNSFVENR